MRRIIHRRVCDTATAVAVASRSYSAPGDFRYFQETLYRQADGLSGTYFLHGQGGPLSKWREALAQNEWGSGERLEGMSPVEALDWLAVANVDVPDEAIAPELFQALGVNGERRAIALEALDRLERATPPAPDIAPRETPTDG